jgi:enoyl-CoA hydratase
MEPWDMGVRKAKRYLFTGERIPAGVALELGMVTDVVEREELETTVGALAERIAGMPPVTLSLIKRSLNRTQDLMGMRDSLELHFALHQFGHATQESRALLHEAREGRPLKDYFNRRDEGKL